MNILTDGGIVTEVERVVLELPGFDEGIPGFAVHGDVTEGFYPEDDVEVIEGEVNRIVIVYEGPLTVDEMSDILDGALGDEPGSITSII